MHKILASFVSTPGIACSLAAAAPAIAVLPLNRATAAFLVAAYTTGGLLAIGVRDYSRRATHRRSTPRFSAAPRAHTSESPTCA